MANLIDVLRAARRRRHRLPDRRAVRGPRRVGEAPLPDGARRPLLRDLRRVGRGVAEGRGDAPVLGLRGGREAARALGHAPSRPRRSERGVRRNYGRMIVRSCAFVLSCVNGCKTIEAEEDNDMSIIF